MTNATEERPIEKEPTEGARIIHLKYTLPLLVSVASAAAAGGAWLYTTGVEAKQVALKAATEAQQAELQKRTRQLEETWSRERLRVELLPSTLGLLRERDCDSDFVAMALLTEIRALEATPRGEASLDSVATAAHRAAINLVLSRSTGSRYCSCETLLALKRVAEEDADPEVIRAAEKLASLAATGSGPCRRNQQARKALKRTAMTARDRLSSAPPSPHRP